MRPFLETLSFVFGLLTFICFIIGFAGMAFWSWPLGFLFWKWCIDCLNYTEYSGKFK